MVRKSLFSRSLIYLVKGYQTVLSPLLRPRCRFHPSCSEYCKQALAEHGILRGLMLACWRLMRCHPLTSGGFDPVPPKK